MPELNEIQKETLDILGHAFTKGASDIHFEPQPKGVYVRFRVEGICRDIRIIEPERKMIFLDETISLFRMRRDRTHVEQSARFAHPTKPVDYRVSLAPCLTGPRLCLRLLERGKEFSLADYPMPSLAKEALYEALLCSSGLIIISGPTGSGKTTLLYSALATINRKEKVVFSVEDPVEYQLPRLNQIPVESHFSFSDAVKNLMRQDLDVAMIGEIRDSDTADQTMRAANSGHLVLSTVHANSAPSVYPKMYAWGVKEMDVKSGMLYVSAQRLKPKLCQDCLERDSRPLACTLASKVLGEPFKPFISSGCSACNHTGYKGMVLILEFGISKNNELIMQQTIRGEAIKMLREGAIDAFKA